MNQCTCIQKNSKLEKGLFEGVKTVIFLLQAHISCAGLLREHSGAFERLWVAKAESVRRRTCERSVSYALSVLRHGSV